MLLPDIQSGAINAALKTLSAYSGRAGILQRHQLQPLESGGDLPSSCPCFTPVELERIAMPYIIRTIDEIACKEQKDVLSISFLDYNHPANTAKLQKRIDRGSIDWRTYKPRKAIVDWLNSNGICHTPCFPMLDEGVEVCPYMGDLYLEVPYDRTHPQYQLLEQHLENPDGSMRQPGVLFMLLPFAKALEVEREQKAWLRDLDTSLDAEGGSAADDSDW